MAKRKETKPALADWQVTIYQDERNAPRTETIQQSRWKRCKAGWYTFTDKGGVVAEYGPGLVMSVRRLEPPVIVHPPAAGGVLPGQHPHHAGGK